MKTSPRLFAYLAALALCALYSVAHAQSASSSPSTACPATACVTVGQPIVFTWTAGAGGPTPDGFNLISGTNLAAVQATAATNVAGANLLSVGNVLTYTITATAAMIGTTTWAANAWNCSTLNPCGVSVLSNSVTVQVSAQSVVVLPVQAPSLTVK